MLTVFIKINVKPLFKFKNIAIKNYVLVRISIHLGLDKVIQLVTDSLYSFLSLSTVCTAPDKVEAIFRY